jgi:RNA polymerase sigma-70 factor (ECF subfamily)
MLAFQRGDENAFTVLFERYSVRVANTAYRFLNDKDAAQDVAQEVFVKIYTSPKTYRPDAAFSTWLYRITANACIDALRRRKRLAAILPEETAQSALDPAASPADQVEARELERAVRTALASLPEKQRIAVVLQRYEGLSYEQIAEILRLSRSAVESLLFRAKLTLRARLSSYVERKP